MKEEGEERLANTKQVPSKMCLRCKRIKPLTDFYKNRAWTEQSGVDLYCKDCCKQMCIDMTTMRKYCWENNRLWMDDMWNAARKRAERVWANQKEWLNPRTSEKKKREIEDRMTCGMFFTVMNLAAYYKFVDNTDEDGQVREFNPDSTDGRLIKTADGEELENEGERVYSATWNGMFTRREIAYLDRYYKRLEDDFLLEDVSIQDYARKICKASLEADNRYDLMRVGKCTSKEWQEAQNIFDALSKSASFTASQRKDKGGGESKVLTDWIRDVIVNHQARKPKITFPKDDIDRILEDFAHTDRAIK